MKLWIPLTLSLALILTTSCRKKTVLEACFDVPTEITAGTVTQFNSGCSEEAVSFLWTFGDGGTSADEHPSHTYMQSGNFTVTLTVENEGGLEDQSSRDVVVLPAEEMEHSGDISSDETWYEGVHLITGNVNVSSAILTIEPGCVIRFSAGAELRVGYGSSSSGATLIAEGTMEKPIVFTSSATNKTAGDWDVMGFYSGASNQSSLTYCTIEYGGGYSDGYGMIYIDDCGVRIEHCQIRYSAHQGIVGSSGGFFTSLADNVFMENGMSDVQIFGNHAHTLGSGNDFGSAKGIAVKSADIEEASVTWRKHNTPYIIQGDLDVGSANGTVLNLDPGVEIAFSGSAEIRFGYSSGTFGKLMAKGSETEMIRFTSAAPAGAGSPGDWDGIFFYEGAGTGNFMDWCVVEYGGGYSDGYGMIFLDGSALSLTNSTIRNSQFQGIVLRDDAMFTACTGNTFEGNGVAPLQIYGNYAHTVEAGNTFNTGPGILVKGADIEEAEVSWAKHSIPWVVDGNLDLGSATGSKLVIEAGARVAFTEGSELRVGYNSGTFGVLEAIGTSGNEVTFTSAAPTGFETSGDWDGIWFYNGTSNGTVLDHCIVKYGGGYGDNSGNLVMALEKPGLPEISNCQIMHSGAWGIAMWVNSASPVLTNNSYSNNVKGDVEP